MCPRGHIASYLLPLIDRCVFRTNVTGRFGIVTGDFGNVTWHSGNVTERTEGRIGVAHDINHAGYARRLLPERACPRTG
jgi:hypothetical protein